MASAAAPGESVALVRFCGRPLAMRAVARAVVPAGGPCCALPRPPPSAGLSLRVTCPRLAHRFATRERNALLLYNGRFNEKHDFIALEVVGEQVQLTFSAGRPPAGSALALRPPGAPDPGSVSDPPCARVQAHRHVHCSVIIF